MKINFDIDKKEVLRYRGHPDSTVPEQLEKVASDVLDKIYDHITPRFVKSRFAAMWESDITTYFSFWLRRKSKVLAKAPARPT